MIQLNVPLMATQLAMEIHFVYPHMNICHFITRNSTFPWYFASPRQFNSLCYFPVFFLNFIAHPLPPVYETRQHWMDHMIQIQDMTHSNPCQLPEIMWLNCQTWLWIRIGKRKWNISLSFYPFISGQQRPASSCTTFPTMSHTMPQDENYRFWIHVSPSDGNFNLFSFQFTIPYQTPVVFDLMKGIYIPFSTIQFQAIGTPGHREFAFLGVFLWFQLSFLISLPIFIQFQLEKFSQKAPNKLFPTIPRAWWSEKNTVSWFVHVSCPL